MDDPSKRRRLIEDIVGIDLPVQHEIDQFGQAKSLWCTLQKVDQPGSNWALGFDLPDKEEPGSEVGGVVFMGGLAHLRCTFRRPWGAHVALYPLPSCRRGGGLVSQPGLRERPASAPRPTTRLRSSKAQNVPRLPQFRNRLARNYARSIPQLC